MHQVVLMSLVGVFMLSATAYGQSLADVARQEEERRRSLNTPASRVYTNRDLGEAPQPAPVSAASAAKPEAAASKIAPEKAEGGEATAEAPKAEVNKFRDEKHWRDRTLAYRERLTKLRADVAAIQSRVETLRAADQTPSTLGELRLSEKDLIKFKNQLASIEKEWSQIEQKAREDKVPGTWLQ
jgi:hypothetical protein